MKNSKKLPTKQLEKFSTIFTQLGLVLVLFIVYLTLEYKTPQKSLAVRDFNPPERSVIKPDQDFVFVREPKTKPKVEAPKSSSFIFDEPLKKVDNKTIETILIDEPEAPEEFDINTLLVVDEPVIDEGSEIVPFISIQNAPVFKGCEGLTKEENKKCFDKKMKRFVQRNFDVELANEIGLNAGKYKIQTQFIINDKGNVVDIKIRAPHSKLKTETQELIEKLPKFTPGKQSNKAVKVRYTLPISFLVD